MADLGKAVFTRTDDGGRSSKRSLVFVFGLRPPEPGLPAEKQAACVRCAASILSCYAQFWLSFAISNGQDVTKWVSSTVDMPSTKESFLDILLTTITPVVSTITPVAQPTLVAQLLSQLPQCSLS